jgi:hypothetical protein
MSTINELTDPQPAETPLSPTPTGTTPDDPCCTPPGPDPGPDR